MRDGSAGLAARDSPTKKFPKIFVANRVAEGVNHRVGAIARSRRASNAHPRGAVRRAPTRHRSSADHDATAFRGILWDRLSSRSLCESAGESDRLESRFHNEAVVFNGWFGVRRRSTATFRRGRERRSRNRPIVRPSEARRPSSTHRCDRYPSIRSHESSRLR